MVPSFYLCLVIGSYLIGSIPTGFVVARLRGVDIRKAGSGNIGATNVFRIVGKPAGVFVLLADASKGYIACTLLVRACAAWFGQPHPAQALESASLLSGVAAILGHNYTCWLRFRGGKGIATSAGVLLAVTPICFATAFGLWLIVFAASRYVSLASVSAAAVLPFGTWWSGANPPLIAITAGLAVLAIFKHRSNIQRLIAGTENRVGGRKEKNRDSRGGGAS